MSPSAPTLLDGKETELRFKLSSLPDELRAWRERAGLARSLEKNHSQIARLTLQLEGLQARVETELDAVVSAGELWLRAESLEKKALALHTLWDVFRNRFALREVDPFDRYLALADAFARECYLAAHKLHCGIPKAELCPAPLVTFDNHISPWARPGAATALSDRQDGGLLTPQEIQDTLKRLPLTLMGLPWSYLAYLPHMALLAHEAGHAVERAADLTTALQLAVAEAPIAGERRDAWTAWRLEVFADLFGCWTAGPAFAWSLADHLSAGQERIASESRPHVNGDWTAYPTATLRVLLACEALTSVGFTREAEDVGQHWMRAYPTHRMGEYVQDLPHLVERFGGIARLAELGGHLFRPAMMQASTRIADQYRAGVAPPKNEPQPARVYVTAARLLLRAPPRTGALKDLWEKLAAHHLVSRPSGLAGREAGSVPNVVEEDERQAGARLSTILFANL